MVYSCFVSLVSWCISCYSFTICKCVSFNNILRAKPLVSVIITCVSKPGQSWIARVAQNLDLSLYLTSSNQIKSMNIFFHRFSYRECLHFSLQIDVLLCPAAVQPLQIVESICDIVMVRCELMELSIFLGNLKGQKSTVLKPSKRDILNYHLNK